MAISTPAFLPPKKTDLSLFKSIDFSSYAKLFEFRIHTSPLRANWNIIGENKNYLWLWRTNLKLRKGFILFMFWEKARKCVCKRKFLEVLPLQCHSCLLNTRRVSLTCVYGVSFFRNQGSLSLRRRRTKRKGEQTIWNVSRWHMIPRRCAESQVHTKKPRKQEIARKIRYIDKVRAKGPRWFYNTV